MTDQARLIACLGSLALLSAVVIVALVFIATALRATATEMRKLHLQQATILGMLLRAGFRPYKRGRDWFDDAHATRVNDELDLTSYDWRKPEG